jgi:Zn-finger nucleic acid-binding protein
VTRLCPACKRPNSAGRAACLYCGAPLDESIVMQGPAALPPPSAPPPESPIKGRSLGCPRCPGAPMAAADLQGLTIFRCELCRGLFLDSLTFDYLVARQADLALASRAHNRPAMHEPADFTVAYIACPVCGQQMARGQYEDRSGVIIDRCLAHGVWLDDAELQRVLDFIGRCPKPLARLLAERAKHHLAVAARSQGVT